MEDDLELYMSILYRDQIEHQMETLLKYKFPNISDLIVTGDSICFTDGATVEEVETFLKEFKIVSS